MTMPAAINLGGDFETAKALLDAIDVQFTIGVEAANIINVAIQVVLGDAQSLDTYAFLVAWLTDVQGADSGLSAAAPDADVVIGTDGVVLSEPVTDLMFNMVTNAAGLLDLDISDTIGTPTWYLNVALPGGGVAVSEAITFA